MDNEVFFYWKFVLLIVNMGKLLCMETGPITSRRALDMDIHPKRQ